MDFQGKESRFCYKWGKEDSLEGLGEQVKIYTEQSLHDKISLFVLIFSLGQNTSAPNTHPVHVEKKKITKITAASGPEHASCLVGHKPLHLNENSFIFI